MSFIGSSRKRYNAPWENYVCLTKEDCRMIQKYVDKIVENRQKRYDYYKGIHEGGEATSRQQTKMIKAEEELNQAMILKSDLKEFLN